MGLLSPATFAIFVLLGEAAVPMPIWKNAAMKFGAVIVLIACLLVGRWAYRKNYLPTKVMRELGKQSNRV